MYSFYCSLLTTMSLDRQHVLRWSLVALLPLLVIGCDVIGGNNDETAVVTDVVVANSGNFSAQDGSLTLYSPSDSSASLNDIDVAFINSVAVFDDRLFVVDNTQADNAGRITSFDTDELGPLDQIQNPRPPRSIAFVSESKGYVTNLSSSDENFNPEPSSVSVVDLDANEVTERVDVGRSPEGLAVTSGKAFVANMADGTLSILNTDSDAVDTTLDLNCASPKEVFVDGENEVAVVCQGGEDESAAVLFVNPETEDIETRISINAPIGSAIGTQSAYYSGDAEELYVISGEAGDVGNGTGAIFRIDTDNNALGSTLQVPENDNLTGISAIGYDPPNEDLYVARLPVGDDGGPLYDANGTTVVLDRDGAVVTRFEVGNSPGHITFLRETR